MTFLLLNSKFCNKIKKLVKKLQILEKYSYFCNVFDFADIKKTFNSVDYVGNQHYVFNIKGNDFRLVVVVKFTPKNVYIRFVGTHSEYDKITDIQNI